MYNCELMSLARLSFLSGIKAELPILLGVVPFGMIYGVLAVEGGLSAAQAQSMSVIVFAGSAQFVMAQLFVEQTPMLVIIATAAMLNLRHVLYSASIAPYLLNLRPLWRFGLAYLLTDEAYAVSITNYQKDESLAYKHWYFLGAGLALWITWQASTAAGILLGAQIPASWPLDFAVALTFIALVVPALEDRASVAAAVSAGVTAVIAYNMPLRLGLIVAGLVGILVGFAVETMLDDRPQLNRTGEHAE
jgi:4-azaleucine resistance transporter AzlC